MDNRSRASQIVSVIMPTYNSVLTVDRAIDSVMAQTHAAWQLIIVDDASTDNTVQRVQDRRRGLENRIVLVCCSENGGPAVARNLGLANSNGDWIAVLDADDSWRQNRLELLLQKVEETSADAVCDNLQGFDDHTGKETQPIYSQLPAWLDITATVAPNYAGKYALGYLKPIIRHSFLEQHRIKYDETLRTGEDFIYLLNLLVHRARVMCINMPLYVYTTQVGASSGKLSRSTKSTPRDLEIVRSLARFRDDSGTNLTARERQAIDDRISYLEDIAPVAEFRHARLQGNWINALSLFFASRAVRARLRDIVKEKLRLGN